LLITSTARQARAGNPISNLASTLMNLEEIKLLLTTKFGEKIIMKEDTSSLQACFGSCYAN
jgi:hypothetical protein